MSDNWILLVPEDPWFIPDTTKQSRARDRLAVLAPKAESIELIPSETVELFNCGSNLERILCPSCKSEVSHTWWRDRLDDDYGEGFRLESYVMPCCGAAHGMHELIYEWLQAFGRFALEARNPDIGMLSAGQQQEFEALLGTKLRVIYQHF